MGKNRQTGHGMPHNREFHLAEKRTSVRLEGYYFLAPRDTISIGVCVCLCVHLCVPVSVRSCYRLSVHKIAGVTDSD